MSFGNKMSIPNNFNKLLLIQSVRQRPALWDRTVTSYKNHFKRTAAWHEVCGILKKDYNKLNETERQKYYKLVIKVWTHTRDSWARSFNARKLAKKAGSFVSPYKHHKEMLFLKKVKFGRIVEDSDDDDDDEDGEEEKEQEIIAESDSDFAAVCENEWNDDSKGDIDLTAMNQDNTTNEVDDTEKRRDSDISEDTLNARLQAYLNKQMRKPSDTHDDRHFAFFKSVHPTLALLDDDQTLEFQSGVINILRNIKSGGRFNNAANNQPSSSRGYYGQPEAPDV